MYSQSGRWILAAAALGFASAFLFAEVMKLDRSSFVLLHGLLVAGFVTLYAFKSGFKLLHQVRRRWLAGVLGGLVVGLALMKQVASQPESLRPHGADLLFAVAWYGLVYGTVDALLLSVVPVLALYGFRSAEDLSRSGGRLRWAGVALVGSAIVTAAYHLGFPEFRGPALIQPLVGNAAITLAYLVTGNPLAAVISHVLMHVAAVWHGMETTVQLPPHY